jgi:ZIP family zinc transporter
VQSTNQESTAKMGLPAFILSLVAGLSTGLGALVVTLFGPPRPTTVSNMLAFAAGIMLYLSLFDIVPDVYPDLGGLHTALFFSGGCVLFWIIASLIPEPEGGSLLNRTSLLVFLCMSLHNLPEGMAVYLASSSSSSSSSHHVQSSSSPPSVHPHSLRLAISIAMHNIPEGIAISCPIYAHTRSRWLPLKYSLISGLAEPAGAILASITSQYLFDDMSAVLATVAGMMAFMSVYELLPASLGYISSANELLKYGIRPVAWTLFGCFSAILIGEVCGHVPEL